MPSCRQPAVPAARMNETDKAGPEADAGEEGDGTKVVRYLMLGETTEGRKFRPGDWADRLFSACGSYARDADIKQMLSENICMVERSGRKGIVFSEALADLEPEMYYFLVRFGENNSLRVSKLEQNQWHKHKRQIIILPKRNFN